jgi:hypothetical protein
MNYLTHILIYNEIKLKDFFLFGAPFKCIPIWERCELVCEMQPIKQGCGSGMICFGSDTGSDF